MACAVPVCLQEVRAFIWCTVKPGAALTLIIEDPAAVGVCAYFESFGIVISQQVGERSRNFCLHPVPILPQWHHLQPIFFSILRQPMIQSHLKQNRIERGLMMVGELSLYHGFCQ